MKKIIFDGLVLKDLANKLLVAIVVLYLVFFGAETILPGVVTSIFNINYLLMAFGLVLLFLLFYSSSSPNDYSPKNKAIERGYFFAIFVFLFFLLFFALFRASLFEVFVYLVLAGVAFKGLLGLFE